MVESGNELFWMTSTNMWSGSIVNVFWRGGGAGIKCIYQSLVATYYRGHPKTLI